MPTIDNVKTYILRELEKCRDGSAMTTRFLWYKSEMPRHYPTHLFDQAVGELEEQGRIIVNRSRLGMTRLRRDVNSD
jgi:hypothetical protein